MKLYKLNENHKRCIIRDYCKYNLIYFKKYYDILVECKNNIDKHIIKWDKYKKFINDYEYIYTNYNMSMNICNIQPVSRSYFKLYEILNDFNIKNINKVVSIAEGPGGFIQCLYDNYKNIKKIYGITLISDDKSVPIWNYKITNKDKIELLDGDGTGDICNKDNIKIFLNIIGENTIDCITCDGGIDYSKNYTNQENESYNFIYHEVLLSLQLQKNSGNLIIKIFDIFNTSTIQLVYLLYLCYDSISIIKPYTSRNTNSEKYLICQNYIYDKNIIDLLYEKYENKILNIHIPESFLNDLQFYNDTYIDIQKNNINDVLDKINSNNIYLDKPNKYQIDKAIKWCNTYNLPINEKCIYLDKPNKYQIDKAIKWCNTYNLPINEKCIYL